MAGSGYDTSTSTARSLASGAEGSADTYISFGNSSVSRGGSTQDLTSRADASATTASPGSSNFGNLPVPSQYNLQQGIVPQVSSNTILVAIVVAILVYALKK